MKAERSDVRFCEFDIEIKVWAKGPPAVGVVRPRRCPGCGEAGHPVGERPGLVGHGLRARQVRGPLGQGEPATVISILLRRYLCRGCGAVVAVGPRGLVRRRLYAGRAIALALARWAGDRQPPARVRRQVSPWRVLGASSTGWAMLKRWAQAATRGAVWRSLACATEPTLRACAARVVALLAALGPPGAALDERAAAGAAHAR